MTDAGWAEKVIARTFQAHKGPLTGYAVKALLAEHKRAVRVVKRLWKVEINKQDADCTRCYLEGVRAALAALQKGRT